MRQYLRRGILVRGDPDPEGAVCLTAILSRPIRSILALTALLVTAYLVFLDATAPRRLAPIDEAQWLFYAHAIDTGKVLYRDVWYQFGPLMLYPLVLAWTLFGKTLAVARLYFFAVNLLGLLIAGFALARITRSLLLTASGLLLLEANAFICRAEMINPSFLMRQCFPLLAITVAIGALRSGRRRSLLFAGLLAGIGVLVAQATGLFGLAAVGLAALTRSLRAATLITLGALLPGLAFCVVTWSQGALLEYVTCSFIDTLTMVGDHQHIPLPGIEALTEPAAKVRSFLPGEHELFTGFLPDQSWFLLTYLPFLLYACGAVLAWCGWRRDRDVSVLLVLVFALCSWSVNLGRSDRYHAAFAAGASIVLGIVLLARLRPVDPAAGGPAPSWLSNSARRSARVGLFLIVAVLGLTGLDQIHLVHRSRSADGQFSSDFPLSGGARLPEAQAERFRTLCRAVAEQGDPQGTLYVLPHDPAFFFFTQLRNPTRFACPIFANHEKYRLEIARDLRQDPPLLLIVDERRYPGIDYDYYLEYLAGFRDDYRPVERHDSTFLEIRR